MAERWQKPSDPPAVITDSQGNKFEPTEFFDHDSQQYLFALRFVGNVNDRETKE
jgi:hypothetical protein